MIKKTGKGQYILFSSNGKRRLSKPGTLAQVQKREKQVQFFKHLGEIRKTGITRIRKKIHGLAGGES